MSLDSFQDSLFDDPIGKRFMLAREKQRWSKESVAQQLKLPISIIEAIEAENWSRLGAPIYIRSYVGSYAKMLGLPGDLADDVIRSQPTPTLVQMNNGSVNSHRSFDRGVLKLGSVVMTGVIVGGVVMLAMHLQSRTPVAADIVPLDPPVTTSVPVPAPAVTAAPAGGESAASPVTTTESVPSPPVQSPVMASLSPSLPAAVNPGELVLNFRGESWLEVTTADGRRVERGIVPAGSQRRYPRGEIQRLTLGNADAVQAEQDGRAVDLAPFREANVARFAVSSDGKVVANGD